MVFAIDPARIQLHAQRLNELADTTPQTKLFLEDHLELTFLDTNVLFAKAISGADDSRAAICTFMDDLNTALTDSATELELTAKRSIELDDAIEAELDAAYPDEKKSGGQASGAPEVSAPGARPSDPSSLLIAPSAPAEDDLAAQILSIDWLSPTALILELINLLPWNPVDEVQKNFAGDWDALNGISEALTGTARYVKSQGENVAFEMATDAASWNGKASEAAGAFFAEMDKLLRDAASQIEKLAPEFAAVAKGMRSAADTLTGLFTQIMDAMIVAAISYAAGAATAATGVGAIIGALAGTGAVAYIIWLAESAWEVIQAVLLIPELLTIAVGVLQTFLLTQPDLPKPTAYDNALV